jgi:hypothetical protein
MEQEDYNIWADPTPYHRPDPEARAKTGGPDPYHYSPGNDVTAVKPEDLQHCADMLEKTVMPLFVRAEAILGGSSGAGTFPKIKPGMFPEGDLFLQAVEKWKADFSKEITALHNGIRGSVQGLRTSADTYDRAEQDATTIAGAT